MTAQHTPGPWNLTEDGYGIYYVNPQIEAGASIHDPQHDSVIARVDGQAVDAAFFGQDDDTLLANARLIAAAPDLLAACEFAYSALCNLTTDDFQRGGDLPIRERLATVIAQATDQQVAP